MSSKPSLYYVCTGCLHPEEKYNQNIHIIGDIKARNIEAHFTDEEIEEYIKRDIAWRISLNETVRHLPSLKYVLTGKLHDDEPFDSNIHKFQSIDDNRNIRSVFMNKVNYFYDPCFICGWI